MPVEEINFLSLQFSEFYQWVCALSEPGSDDYYKSVESIIKAHYFQKISPPYYFRRTTRPTKMEVYMQDSLVKAAREGKIEDLNKILAVEKIFNVLSESFLKKTIGLAKLNFNAPQAIVKINDFLKERKLNPISFEKNLQSDTAFQEWITSLNSEEALKRVKFYLSAVKAAQEEVQNNTHCLIKIKWLF